MVMRRKLACCTRNKEDTIDFGEQDGVMAYNGLESCIFDSRAYDSDNSTSRRDRCASESFGDDGSSCSSSSNAFGSFSSQWMVKCEDNFGANELDLSSHKLFYIKGKSAYKTQLTDKDIMKEKFAKLLLEEDFTGGTKGISTALALSNAITNLAVSVFGELWRLEPLSEERKCKWRREMDWLLSPTNYMIELVPAKQNDADGRTFEIMTPKVREDVYMNLPALQKLDSILIETLDSMVDTEFWYADVGTRAEGRSREGGQSKRCWLPHPGVPTAGLSDAERRKLLNLSKLVHQVFKAANSINENVLLDMPIPSKIRDGLPKSGKASLGREVYKVLTSNSSSAKDMASSLNLKSEHSALQAINRLEAAVFAWKQRITEKSSSKSSIPTSWSFVKASMSELQKNQVLLRRAEALLQHLKSRYPNLPQTFLAVVKIQYGKDLGYSILEAYSRVLANLAYNILSRIGDILQEDMLSNPNPPAAICQVPRVRTPSDITAIGSSKSAVQVGEANAPDDSTEREKLDTSEVPGEGSLVFKLLDRVKVEWFQIRDTFEFRSC